MNRYKAYTREQIVANVNYLVKQGVVVDSDGFRDLNREKYRFEPSDEPGDDDHDADATERKIVPRYTPDNPNAKSYVWRLTKVEDNWDVVDIPMSAEDPRVKKNMARVNEIIKLIMDGRPRAAEYITVTSRYRDVAYNKEKGGVAGSLHQWGAAFDLSTNNSQEVTIKDIMNYIHELKDENPDFRALLGNVLHEGDHVHITLKGIFRTTDENDQLFRQSFSFKHPHTWSYEPLPEGHPLAAAATTTPTTPVEEPVPEEEESVEEPAPEPVQQETSPEIKAWYKKRDDLKVEHAAAVGVFNQLVSSLKKGMKMRMLQNVYADVSPEEFKSLNPIEPKRIKDLYESLYNSYKNVLERLQEIEDHRKRAPEGLAYQRATTPPLSPPGGSVNEARKIRSLIVREVRNLLDPT